MSDTEEPAADTTAGNEPAANDAGQTTQAETDVKTPETPTDKFYIPPEDKPEEWGELYTRLGRPEAADKYKIDFREIDKPFAETMQKAFFDNGLSQKAAAGVVKAWTEMQEKQAADWTETSKKELAAWEQAQGDGLAKNQELARRGSAALGLDEESLGRVEAAIGTRAFMDLCLKLGNGLSEDTAKGLGGGTATKTEAMSTVDYLNEIFAKAKGEQNG